MFTYLSKGEQFNPINSSNSDSEDIFWIFKAFFFLFIKNLSVLKKQDFISLSYSYVFFLKYNFPVFPADTICVNWG